MTNLEALFNEVGSRYARIYGGLNDEPPPQNWAKVAVGFLVVANVLLIGASIVLLFTTENIVISGMHLTGSVQQNTLITLRVSAACFIFIGAVGLLAALWKHKLPICAFIILIIIALPVCVGLGVLTLVMSGAVDGGGGWKDLSEEVWKALVVDDPAVICDMQNTLSCSGFDAQSPGLGCCVPGKCYNATSPPEWVHDYCPVGCASNNSTALCNDKLHDAFYSKQVWLLICTFGMTGIILVAVILSCALLCCYRKTTVHSELFEYSHPRFGNYGAV